MELTTALVALRRGWAFILVGVLAAAVIAAGLQRVQDPVYRSDGTYLVIPSASDPDIIESIKTLDSTRSRTLLTTLTEIMTSASVFTEAATGLGIDPSAPTGITVAAAPLTEANGVTLQVMAPSPDTARAMADAVGTIGAQRFVDFYRIYEVTILDAPTLPTEPAGPGLPALLALAGVLGAVVGGGVALLRNPDPARRRSSVSHRIDAYGPNVTPLRGRDRFTRTG